jgi:ATP-independent RNA helicase DbpA
MQNNSFSIQEVLKNLQFSELNKMQEATLEAFQKSTDLVLLSPTGSGKTVGFLLPVLQAIKSQKNGVQALILAPSRELALQIEQVFRSMGTGYKVNCCYGGHLMKTEKNNFQQTPTVLIGTPGRIADHINRKNFDPSSIDLLVLDEFDKSLELGYKQEMSFIISQLKGIKKRILTSATKMADIPDFTGITNPMELNYLSEITPDSLTIKAVRSFGKDKLDALYRLICEIGDEASLVFCNHREAVDRISELLWQKNMAHDVFHGGMDQEERERALIKFRNGSHRMLVTTDLASRGLDIPEIRNIIHYQLPGDEKIWTHRNGRTARMKANGTAYLLLSQDEYIPPFIKDLPEFVNLPEQVQLPEPPQWVTLYIGAGKKDKINKIDIVGFLLQKGNLQKDDLGLIEVLDFVSYAAVKWEKAASVLKLTKNEAIKKKKVKIAISK